MVGIYPWPIVLDILFLFRAPQHKLLLFHHIVRGMPQTDRACGNCITQNTECDKAYPSCAACTSATWNCRYDFNRNPAEQTTDDVASAMVHVLRQKVKAGLKHELLQELRQELKQEILQELPQELRQELKQELQKSMAAVQRAAENTTTLARQQQDLRQELKQELQKSVATGKRAAENTAILARQQKSLKVEVRSALMQAVKCLDGDGSSGPQDRSVVPAHRQSNVSKQDSAAVVGRGKMLQHAGQPPIGTFAADPGPRRPTLQPNMKTKVVSMPPRAGSLPEGTGFSTSQIRRWSSHVSGRLPKPDGTYYSTSIASPELGRPSSSKAAEPTEIAPLVSDGGSEVAPLMLDGVPITISDSDDDDDDDDTTVDSWPLHSARRGVSAAPRSRGASKSEARLDDGESGSLATHSQLKRKRGPDSPDKIDIERE